MKLHTLETFRVDLRPTIGMLLLLGLQSLAPLGAGKILLAEERKSTEELLQSAREHYFHERYNIALKLFQIVQEQDPENPETYSLAGDILLKQGKLEEAETSFRIAAELAPDPAPEYFRLGQTLFLQKKASSALEAFRRSLQADPKLFQNHFYAGMVYIELLDRPEKGMEAWESYLRLVPDDPRRDKMEMAMLRMRAKIKMQRAIPRMGPWFRRTHLKRIPLTGLPVVPTGSAKKPAKQR